jgi:FAD/FMN-containing dehydrogenase
MGNFSSTAAAVSTCLESAVGKDYVVFNNDPLYQVAHVKPYNLGIKDTPAAVTYPRSAEHISQIVKCAVNNNLKVQPRSGGHSYANFGTLPT